MDYPDKRRKRHQFKKDKKRNQIACEKNAKRSGQSQQIKKPKPAFIAVFLKILHTEQPGKQPSERNHRAINSPKPTERKRKRIAEKRAGNNFCSVTEQKKQDNRKHRRNRRAANRNHLRNRRVLFSAPPGKKAEYNRRKQK